MITGCLFIKVLVVTFYCLAYGKTFSQQTLWLKFFPVRNVKNFCLVKWTPSKVIVYALLNINCLCNLEILS